MQPVHCWLESPPCSASCPSSPHPPHLPLRIDYRLWVCLCLFSISNFGGPGWGGKWLYESESRLFTVLFPKPGDARHIFSRWLAPCSSSSLDSEMSISARLSPLPVIATQPRVLLRVSICHPRVPISTRSPNYFLSNVAVWHLPQT